jgi:hypothetical protein
MPTVRIYIPNDAALDGVTPINFATAQTAVNQAEQVTEYFLTSLDNFGYFDPGSVFGNQSADMMLTHFLFSCQAGIQTKQIINIVPPNFLLDGAYGGIPFAARPLWASGLGTEFDSSGGVVAEGNCLPIPVDHKLSFLTGDVYGPYLIQMTFSPVPKTDQDWDVPVTPDDAFVGFPRD